MNTPASRLINLLGGTSATSRKTKTPISTVHSWRKNGIPEARRDHMRLVAKEEGLVERFDLIAAGGADDQVAACGRCGERAESPDVERCTSVHCPMRQKEAA